jgi:hypothetical protein
MAAATGKKVLICALDPQMNATQQLGFDNMDQRAHLRKNLRFGEIGEINR